jgi:exopolysaccharide biosynthesis protein
MITYLLIFIIFVWIIGLSYYWYRLKKNYLQLTQGSKKTLDEVLSDLVHDEQKIKEDIAKIIVRCDRIEKDEGYHIQKVGLLRFNPFKDTGGDQSFILALVDAHDTGIILTALYSRSSTRWYTKRVTKGKGAEHELSEEEKKALHMASELK